MSRVHLEAGTRIGDFEIEVPLGAGAVGTVYRARQVSLNRAVALKVQDGSGAGSLEVERFRRAAEAAARLSHPNLAAVHAAGIERGVCYLAMELIDGASLLQAIERIAAAPNGTLVRLPNDPDQPDRTFSVFVRTVIQEPDSPPPGEPPPAVDVLALALDGPAREERLIPTREEGAPADSGRHPGGVGPGPDLTLTGMMVATSAGYHRLCCEWVRDAARGMEHAHAAGVIHRDLKPGNLMLGRDGRVRVIDFGLARWFEDPKLTATGQITGSPLYMSPEQLTGRIELSARTDVYSLGLVLFELLTLGPPLVAGHFQELFQRIISKPLTPITHINPRVPPVLAAIVHKAAAKDPDERYESAGGLADELDRFLVGEPVSAPRYDQPSEEQEALGARPPLISALAGQICLGVFLWVGYASFLATLSGSRAQDLVPLLALGRAGSIVAYAVAAALAVAAVRMVRASRGGYEGGLFAQGVLLLTALTSAVTFYRLRSLPGVPETELGFLFRQTIVSAAIGIWLVYQLRRYCSRSVRAWFERVRRSRRIAPDDDLFRGRGVTIG